MPNPRRAAASRAKGSRAVGPAAGPTPVASQVATPASSVALSAVPSDTEIDLSELIKITDPNKLPISALTLDVPLSNSKPKRTPVPKIPFRFFELPTELRLKIYAHHFAGIDGVLDLDPDNYRRIHQKLAILRVCRTFYVEASHLFYSTRAVRIFPTHPGKFFKTKKPLLARMKPRQRACMTHLQLRLGPGWSKPPRGWVVNPELGLADCVRVTKLTVFVEFDPSNEVFKEFRRSEGFYEKFSTSLLEGVVQEMPWIQRIEFDGWSGVKKNGAMMKVLLDTAARLGKTISWGPERGWTDADEEPTKLIRFENGPITSKLESQLGGVMVGA